MIPRAILTATILPVLGLALGAASDTDLSGKLDTLRHGRWTCETPGDATEAAVHPIPDEWFEVINNSSYRNKDGHGTYLLAGNKVYVTRGPLLGRRFIRTSSSALRQLDINGDETDIRCVRSAIGD
ncbi:hypothetical protein [Tsuneonella mangrovi]|uniref:hypothetical protein n=1 Tax=Tsuneonella mangrovi TaxID=1982042 RepID=UPI0012374873|nr:hypothetical protein [Tsuneonella mangrovi]